MSLNFGTPIYIYQKEFKMSILQFGKTCQIESEVLMEKSLYKDCTALTSI